MGYTEEGVPFVTGSETSQEAAEKKNGEPNEHLIYKFLVERAEHGATCDEAEVALGLTHQNASARFNALERQRRVFVSGKKRLTRWKRRAGVYVVDKSWVGPDLKIKTPKPKKKEMVAALADLDKMTNTSRAQGFISSPEFWKMVRWLKK